MNMPARPKAPRLAVTSADLAELAPIPATEDMPPEIQALLKPQAGFVRSATKPKMGFATEKVEGTADMWRVLDSAYDEEMRDVLPGQELTELDARDFADTNLTAAATEGFRPPWATHEFMPRLVPFRDRAGRQWLEPRVHEEPLRLAYPMRTVGIVKNSEGYQGSGVLVGPNLLLTAGHVVPWGASSWNMEFIPAYKASQAIPYGRSFVRRARGFNTRPHIVGHDYAICQLYTPLGNAVGWMGSMSFGSEDDYYRRLYVSSGYPASYRGRQAVEHDMGIRDIDDGSPGLELEFALRDGMGEGWSGGPLWLPAEGASVCGVFSGDEKDGLDPRRHVYAGGGPMVDLVRFGLDNWRP
jgi:hypothetical protein